MAEPLKCVACLNAPANSDEHVFQSALGGRLTYPVLCKPCNDRFGDSIDVEITDALHGFRVVLGIEGDRGQVPSMRVSARDGRDFIIESGGRPRAARRPPEVKRKEGTQTTLVVDSMKTALDYLRSMEKKNPNPARVIAAERIRTFPAETDFPIVYGGDGFYRSALRAGLIFIAGQQAPIQREDVAKPWGYVRGGPDAVEIISMPCGEAPWTHPDLGSIPHLLSVEMRAGRCRIDVRYFLHFSTIFEFAIPADIEWSNAYGIDPLTGAQQFGTPNPILGMRQDPAGETLSMEYACSAIMAIAYQRMLERVVERVTDESWQNVFGGLPVGTEITEEMAERHARQTAARFAQLMLREESRENAPDLVEELNRRK